MNGPNGLAINAEDPNRLYLAARGRQTPASAADDATFISTDGGSSWRNVLSQEQQVYDVTPLMVAQALLLMSAPLGQVI